MTRYNRQLKKRTQPQVVGIEVVGIEVEGIEVDNDNVNDTDTSLDINENEYNLIFL